MGLNALYHYAARGSAYTRLDMRDRIYLSREETPLSAGMTMNRLIRFLRALLCSALVLADQVVSLSISSPRPLVLWHGLG